MGHKIGYVHRPHRGSMGVWPRKRAKRQYPRVDWKQVSGVTGRVGFAAYKAGMSHAIIIDNRKSTPTKNQPVFWPVTILEAPPLKVIGLRFYKSTPYGLKTVSDIITRKFDKYLKRKLIQPKKEAKNFDEITDYDEIRLLVQAQPHLIKLKKTPEVFELGLGGTLEDKKNYAKDAIEKEIRISEVFKEGMQIDINAVTKGKGFQGSVKRHGVTIRQHKSEKTKRAAGTLAPVRPRKVDWRVPQFGQMGYHTRTEFNKIVLKIGDKPEEVNPKGGFKGYGLVTNDYIVLKGSVLGPRKRLIMLRYPVRPNKAIPNVPPQIKYFSLASKQGCRK